MIFGEETRWVFSESPHTGQPKTQICLPVLPDDLMLCKPSGEIVSVRRGVRNLVAVDGVYCVKEEHRKPPLGSIKVTRVRVLDMRWHVAYVPNGYSRLFDFLRVWAHHHDAEFYDKNILGKTLPALRLAPLLNGRPNHLYRAWAVDFVVV